MIERKVYNRKANCNNSPILYFNNSSNRLFANQYSVRANVTDKTVRITVHRTYLYTVQTLEVITVHEKNFHGSRQQTNDLDHHKIFSQ